MNLLELRSVGFAVAGGNGRKKQVLDGVNLCVKRGEIVVVTGRNGSGKTILSKIIMGIERPSCGTVMFNGEDVTEAGISGRADKGIGLAFQQPVRFKGLSIKNLLRISAGKRLSEKQASEYLVRVGLNAEEYLERELNNSLSGGEMKRVEIAVLLAREAELMIFDEPEAGIDLWTLDNLTEVFRELRREQQGAVVIISHNADILRLADRVLLLHNRKLVAVNAEEMLGKRL